VEELAGIKSLKPGSALAGKVLDGREAEAISKPGVPPPVQAVVAEPQPAKKKESPAKVVAAEPAVNPAPGVEEDEVSQVEEKKNEGEAEPVQGKSAPVASTARLKLQKVASSESRAGANGTSKVVAGEGGKSSLKTTQAPVTKKSGDGLGVKKPILQKRSGSVMAAAVAEVPAGGLQPMKVELAEMEAVLETPQEREKKRGDQVELFLRSLQLQGVRLQGAESRILVDGVPIGVGEKVGSLGLVLESVESQKIIFSDANGKKYLKSY
jgi:hypothetical protein